MHWFVLGLALGPVSGGFRNGHAEAYLVGGGAMTLMASMIRRSAALLGSVSGLVSISHGYDAFEIEVPFVAIAVLAVAAVLKIATSAYFGLAPSRKGDGTFLFIFGVAAVGDVTRFLLIPFKSLLITPAALLAGAATLWMERRRRVRPKS